MPDKLPRTASVALATIIAALVTAAGTILAAKQTLKVQVNLPETGKESFSLEAASNKIQELSKKLTLAEAEISSLQGQVHTGADSKEVSTLRERIRTLEQQLRSRDEAQLGDRHDPPGPHDRDTEDVKYARDFKFQLVSCVLSGSTVGCDLLVTNLLGDRDASFKTAATRIIAESGDEYLATNYVLGAKTGKYGVRSTLPGSIPIKARLEFGSVRPGTERLQLLTFGLYARDASGHREETTVRFGPPVILQGG